MFMYLEKVFLYKKIKGTLTSKDYGVPFSVFCTFKKFLTELYLHFVTETLGQNFMWVNT